MNRLVKKPIEMRFVRLPGRSARTDWVLRSEQRCSAAPRYLMEVHPVPKLAPRPTPGSGFWQFCHGGVGTDPMRTGMFRRAVCPTVYYY